MSSHRKPRLFALRCWILEWLLAWRISSGDHRSARRLLALYRLQRMHRWREYRELLEMSEQFGLDQDVYLSILDRECLENQANTMRLLRRLTP